MGKELDISYSIAFIFVHAVRNPEYFFSKILEEKK